MHCIGRYICLCVCVGVGGCRLECGEGHAVQVSQHFEQKRWARLVLGMDIDYIVSKNFVGNLW